MQVSDRHRRLVSAAPHDAPFGPQLVDRPPGLEPADSGGSPFPAGAKRSTAIQLLVADEDLARYVPEGDLATARRLLVVPRLDVPMGEWRVPPAPSWAATGTSVVVVSGLLARNALLGDRTSTQLLGPGDVVDPWGAADELLPCVVRWRVHQPVTLAALDARFAAAARRWPGLALAVQQRLNARADRLAAQGVALQLPNVDQRVIATLWQLADRFGRIVPGGVVIPLRLSHQLIGQLVGAQRPTVTLALGKLSQSGDLERREDGTWFVSTDSRQAVLPSAA
jgi:CRP-like cAMP-binding protein